MKVIVKTALFMLLVGLFAGALQAQDTDKAKTDKASDKTEAKSAKKASDVVVKAITKLAGDHKVKVKLEGSEGWCGKWVADGKEHQVFVDAKGTLLKTEVEVDAKDVPEALRVLATANFDKDSKQTWVKVTLAADDKVSYEVEGKKDGKKLDLLISADGKTVTAEEEDDDEAGEEEDDDDDEADDEDDDDDDEDEDDEDDDDDDDEEDDD